MKGSGRTEGGGVGPRSLAGGHRLAAVCLTASRVAAGRVAARVAARRRTPPPGDEGGEVAASCLCLQLFAQVLSGGAIRAAAGHRNLDGAPLHVAVGASRRRLEEERRGDDNLAFEARCHLRRTEDVSHGSPRGNTLRLRLTLRASGVGVKNSVFEKGMVDRSFLRSWS